MCEFINTIEKLKSSSGSSVANEKFTAFNDYMHIASKMDDTLAEVVRNAAGFSKALVLVCGNSGDGKSHLIARLKKSGVIDDTFEIYIDATSADKKGMKANEKLREKLLQLSDAQIDNGNTFKIIVAINLGILNDFLKNYASEFSLLKKYVDEQRLFESVPAWKYKKMRDAEKEVNTYFIGHVDFTSFHRYSIVPGGLNLQFIHGLLAKIVADDERNDMRAAFDRECSSCPKRSNCPVFWNYKRLAEDEKYRDYAVEILAETIIKHNISPSVREINNFFYEIIVGNSFDEAKVNANSTERLVHFIENLSLNLLFEGHDGLLALVSEQDALNNAERRYDKELIRLNLKPSFEKWIKETAAENQNEFAQIEKNLTYCQANFAKEYRAIEEKIKRSLFKYYIRLNDSKERQHDERYEQFLKYLYAYNIGDEQKCKDLIGLIKDCVYVWNGRLGEKTGGIVKNAVICGRCTDRYFSYKIVEIQFRVDKSVEKLNGDEELTDFASVLRFNFAIKDKPSKMISLDVDFELFNLLTRIREGYIPTNADRKRYVNFDSFVRALLSESESDSYFYSRYGDGKIYRITKDEFGAYAFESEG